MQTSTTTKAPVELVEEFHKLFNHPIKETIEGLEPLQSRQFSVKMLFEELAELAEASDVRKTLARLCVEYLNKQNTVIVSSGGPVRLSEQNIMFGGLSTDGDNVDQVEELDAVNDIEYFLNGKKLRGGYHKVSHASFYTVHQNNMTKAHRSDEHAMETVKANGLEGYVCVRKDSNWLLFNMDKKLVKPHDHKKVSLEPFITGTVDMSKFAGEYTVDQAKIVAEEMKNEIQPYLSTFYKEYVEIYNEVSLVIWKHTDENKGYRLQYQDGRYAFGKELTSLISDAPDIPTVVKDLVIKEFELRKRAEEEAERKLTINEVQDAIVKILEENDFALTFETGRINQSYGKHASRLIDDFEKVTAITVIPKYVANHAGVPIHVMKTQI
jgi:hypothetical protein